MIDKIMFWNIRSVNTQNAFERLIDLNRRHHYKVISLMKPFQEAEDLDIYRSRLGFDNAITNVSDKIQIFWSGDWNATVVANEVQHVTLKLHNPILQKEVMFIAVYAKCDAMERHDLWESVSYISLNHQMPWIVGGDFNIILSEEEKQGGLPVLQQETADFAQFVNMCGLVELKYYSSRFTWWNGRIDNDCIFKRPDRVFGNQELMQILSSNEVTHLIRKCSDHASLHVLCDRSGEGNWLLDFATNPFVELHAKMKKVKKALANWNKNTYGNHFQQVSTLEDVIKVKELQLEINPSGVHREQLHKAQAELNRFLNIEEEYWKQKSGMKWF
ncbi:uncharacterized protein LOC132048754 [Lycium ferocissimum]|uniref:uncharacterized protein LOC132048754 n=1 Tax=Lycium ferocissimum TaxID=112874 RepID=UPI0028152AF4|nr:uncharacterized protein LOC132048754 [Lycium ferocissimum]